MGRRLNGVALLGEDRLQLLPAGVVPRRQRLPDTRRAETQLLQLPADLPTALGACLPNVLQADHAVRQLLADGPAEEALLVEDANLAEVLGVVANHDPLADVGGQRRGLLDEGMQPSGTPAGACLPAVEAVRDAGPHAPRVGLVPTR